ncbi:hypothetical protein L6452_31136 [Arctium lappa]|uniref:Uncharacterized protein n=1 Tax=Arctium lappa TaxID=4217 RepID=A0ACB8ZKJ4_ARCLA|nr:hypothetical protein L6452_31136 [Arctium lappa]
MSGNQEEGRNRGVKGGVSWELKEMSRPCQEEDGDEIKARIHCEWYKAGMRPCPSFSTVRLEAVMSNVSAVRGNGFGGDQCLMARMTVDANVINRSKLQMRICKSVEYDIIWLLRV